MVKRTLIFLITLILCGCAGEETGEKEPGVVEYMTGAQQLKTYQETKTRLQDIGSQKKDQLKEVYGE